MRGFWGVWHAGLSQLRQKIGVTHPSEGVGTANTALVYHAKKLLALHEGDLPYAVCHHSLQYYTCSSAYIDAKLVLYPTGLHRLHLLLASAWQDYSQGH